MADANPTDDLQVIKAIQGLQMATLVTALFGAFQILYAVAATVFVRLPIPFGQIVHGVMFLVCGLFLAKRQWWCLWMVLPLSILTIGYELPLLLKGASWGLVFLLVLAVTVFVTNLRLVSARHIIDRAATA